VALCGARAADRTRAPRRRALSVAADGPPRLAAFLKRLQELGWIDGHNVRIDVRWGAGEWQKSIGDSNSACRFRPTIRDCQWFRHASSSGLQRHIQQQYPCTQPGRLEGGASRRADQRMNSAGRR
jgi:hypothetical protein